MWCTPMSARSPAYARALAYTTPTSSAPTRPGPAVTATASTARRSRPASTRARSTTAGSAARWARLASSGTTPPNTWWMSCDRMTRLASSPETRTAADVSSHEVSMPRTTSATACAAPQGDRVGDGAGGDPPRRDHGDAGDAGVAHGPRDVGDHAQAVPGERLHLLLGSADRHRNARRGHDEAGDRARARLHRHPRERPLGQDPHLTGDGDLLRRDTHEAERRRVDRDGARERPRHVGDLGRDGRHGFDRREVLVGSHQPGDGGRDRHAAVQHLARLRDDPDERHDADVLAAHAVQGDGDLARADLEHA